MTEQEEEKKHKPSFTFIHVLLLSIFITTISLNKVSELGKNQLKASKKLAEIEYQIFRKLDDTNDTSKFKEDTKNVCSKANEKLQDYYKTGDKSLIGLDDSNRKESEAGYIKALVDIIANQAGGSSGRRLGEENGGGEEAAGDSSDLTTNLKKYLIHVIPVLAFFVIAILSIPGWVVCCSCCCCNCCCCCCCKRPICRFPFFIVTMVFDGIVLISCIYGLANSNKVFVGFANVECSLMQFIKEVTDGQSKNDNSTSTWVGIDGINNLLDSFKDKVAELQGNTVANLEAKQNSISTTAYDQTKVDLADMVNGFKVSQKETYEKDYWLLTYEICGLRDEPQRENSFSSLLTEEYNKKITKSNEYISETITNFKNVFNNSFNITGIIDDAKNSINDIKQPVDDVKDMVAGKIVDYSDMIDEKGKLGFKLVYSVLTIVVAVNAALVVVYFVFGTTLCSKFRILRCLNKVFIHIFWNILALLMIITFIIGAVLTLVGTLGNDLVSVVSHFIGEDNLNATSPVLIGSAAKYLKPCLIGDGDLSDVLDFNSNSATSSITELQNLTAKIDAMIATFKANEESTIIKTYSNDISLNSEGKSGAIVFKVALCPQGDGIVQNEKWKIYGGTENDDDRKIKDKFTALKNLGFKAKVDELGTEFKNLAGQERSVLETFKETITNLTSLFTPYIGTNGSIFNFLNCKFIGDNLDIILKYLKEAIGSNIYSVGIFLLVAGCSMIFSIIFTILEVIIINAAIDDKLKNPISAVSKFV